MGSPPKNRKRLALRARIVLSCAEGMETGGSHGNYVSPTKQYASGASAFGLHGWRVWPTNLGLVRRDRLQMRRWKL